MTIPDVPEAGTLPWLDRYTSTSGEILIEVGVTEEQLHAFAAEWERRCWPILAEAVGESRAKLTAGEHDEPCPHDRPVGGWQSAKCVKPRGHETHWNGSGDVWRVDVKGMAAEVETLRAEVESRNAAFELMLAETRQQRDELRGALAAALKDDAIEQGYASGRDDARRLVQAHIDNGEAGDWPMSVMEALRAVAEDMDADRTAEVGVGRWLELVWKQAIEDRNAAWTALDSLGIDPRHAEAGAQRIRADVAQLTADRDSLIKAGEALAADRDEARTKLARCREDRDEYGGQAAAAEKDAEQLGRRLAEVLIERDEAQALLRLAPHHQQQVVTLGAELVQARAEVVRLRRAAEKLAAELAELELMATSTPPSTPESDGQGEVAVTDAVEAPGGAEDEPSRMDCAERCEVPAGVRILESPPSRHAWSDVVRCPNDGCEKTFLVIRNEGPGDA